MRQQLNRFFTPNYEYSSALDLQRARSMLVILSFGALGTLIYSVAILAQIGLGATEFSMSQLAVFATPVVTIGLIMFVNRGSLRIPIIVLIAFTLLTSMGELQTSNASVNSIGVVIPIVIAGALLGWRGTLITLGAVLLVLAQVAFSVPQNVTNQMVTDFALVAVELLIIAVWMIIFGTNIHESARRTLDNFERLRFIDELEAQPAGTETEQDIGESVIRQLRENFGYHFAQIFLVDADQTIQQRLSSGFATGQVEVARGNAIHEVIRTGRRIHLTRQSNLLMRSHFLPGTQAGVALPVRSGNALVAVLDVQTEEFREFDQSELLVLSLLSGYLGNILGRMRAVSVLRADLHEQEALIATLRDRLRELQQTSERETTVGWTAYLQQRNLEYLGFDLHSDVPQPTMATGLNDELRAALSEDDITIERKQDYQVMNVPILLRGQKLGVMTFKIPAEEQALGGRQRELIRSVVQRLGLALENKRLFERSQSQAQRESTANEIGNLLLTTTDVESVMRLAATSFNDALGAIQTNIQLQPDGPDVLEEKA